MKITSAAKVGFTAVIIVLVMIAVFKGMGKGIPWLTWISGPKDTYSINASFTSVKGLKPGAEVQLNGSRIGEVGDITNDGFGGVKVALQIRNTQYIHEHAKITISRDSIFGQYLVSIDELRSGHLEGRIENNQFSILIEPGLVQEGQLVVRDNETVGSIVTVSRHDALSDRVTIEISPDFVVDETMAFVPTQITAGSNGLRIYNKLPPDVVVEGTREPGPEDLVVDADKALMEITDQATQIMERLATLLDNFSNLVSPEDVNSLLDNLSTDTKLISSNILDLTNRLNVILSSAQPNIDNTFANIEGATSDARDLIQGFSEYNNPEFRASIEQIITNLDTATNHLVTILEDVEGYTADEELRTNITATITEARSTLEMARGTLNDASGAIDEAAHTMDTVSSVETGAEFRIRYTPDPNRWAADLNIRVGLEGSDAFITGGIEDLGETDRTNARIGFWINDTSSARAGIYRGKIGLGVDWREDTYRFISEVYDPNDLKWDLYAGYAILPELDVLIGVEDIIGDENVNLALAYSF
ncbi:MAG: MlaD family protein [bacterium]|nr:MlaD family protein [bacterium]